ncbi:hypothetical protein [Alkalinema sp. FACHB-956]|uniref:hypothetical protein n=1 Tax=Alkalinema sp. FACHB-956 TaxID=2692768 RepID=UPI0016835F94|nr:hypothetical protein [Alkalinema sp. FACHB-956]MBD2326242.1 hypothetical protein [Alkalinema sp. FACHB-956]
MAVIQVDRENPKYAFACVETSELEAQFLELAEQWRQETGMFSVVSQIVIHPAYQRIIGMGQPVVPLLLRDLEQEPDHWFWALQAITGENPVKQEHRGNLQQMAIDWLEWGKAYGYRW